MQIQRNKCIDIFCIIAFVNNIFLASISWLYMDSSSLSVSPDTSPKKWTDGSVRDETRRPIDHMMTSWTQGPHANVGFTKFSKTFLLSSWEYRTTLSFPLRFAPVCWAWLAQYWNSLMARTLEWGYPPEYFYNRGGVVSWQLRPESLASRVVLFWGSTRVQIVSSRKIRRTGFV